MAADGGGPPRLKIETLGCRLNAYESEAMARMAEEAGLDAASPESVHVINSCAVTAEAVKQARRAVRRIRRENPDARIIVTGCAAQTEPETFAAMPEVDLVLGNSEKMQPESWRRLAEKPLARGFDLEADEKVLVDDIFSARETAGHLIDGFGTRARAFVQVQNGCDHRCTFCIIPYGRGNSRSAPAGVVVDQIRRLVDRGYREVVLTGVDLTSWGDDLPALGGRTPRLGDLVQRILKLVPGLARLRISSIDSVEADPALWEALGETRLAPHLHLSLQAGADLILKRMKRRHLREDAIRFCARARSLRPDIVFGADLIAGFPTETEAHFEDSLALVDECGLTFLHVFPYSPRKGTPAAKMPQLPPGVAKERAARLRALGAVKRAAYLGGEIGRERQVLVETPTMGRAETFAEVAFATPPCAIGEVAPMVIRGADADRLLA